jgi:hypothetical protein
MKPVSVFNWKGCGGSGTFRKQRNHRPINRRLARAMKGQVISEITDGLSWLADQNPDANVSFTYEINYSVPTSYEPINHALLTDESLWIGEAMSYLGFSGHGYTTQVRDYTNALRRKLNADWAFAIFVVDSLNDTDGAFTDDLDETRKWHAHSTFGGPFIIMTYDNGEYGIDRMDYVTAHETCHIFYATDEYNGQTERSGYLGVYDNENANCLMKTYKWSLCYASREQLGWRDTNGDGIQDIVDTFPKTSLMPYSPNPNHEPNSCLYWFSF